MLHEKVPGLNRTVHITNEWLKEIADEMNHPDEQVAYHALRGTLFAMRDRIPVEEAMDLAAQLPALIRGIYFEGYKTTNKPETFRTKEEFLERVNAELQATEGDNPERAARAVFAVLSRRISLGEIEDVRSSLPEQIRNLWPTPETARSQ